MQAPSNPYLSFWNGTKGSSFFLDLLFLSRKICLEKKIEKEH